MNSLTLTIVLIGCCVLAIALLVMAKPIKIILGIFLNAIFGAGGIFVANMLLAPLGITVGINLLTLGFTGVLGLPGFCAVIFISALI